MTDPVVRSRIDPVLKRQADQVLKRMGLTMSDAIRLFLHQVVAEQTLPFPIEAPNATTLKALEAVERGEGLEPVTLEQLASEWDTECGK